MDLLTTGALLTLAASPGITCQMPKAAEINVIPVTQSIKYDYSKNLAELQNQQIDTINPYDFSSASHAQAYAYRSLAMTPSVKLGHSYNQSNGAVCIWYDRIDVKFEIDPTIFIAKEVKADECKDKAIREHELKHVMVDRKMVNKYAKIIGKKLYDNLKQRGFMAGPVKADYAQQVADRMQKTVGQIVDHEYQKMTIELREAQQAVDSLQEYERVRALCPEFATESYDALQQRR